MGSSMENLKTKIIDSLLHYKNILKGAGNRTFSHKKIQFCKCRTYFWTQNCPTNPIINGDESCFFACKLEVVYVHLLLYTVTRGPWKATPALLLVHEKGQNYTNIFTC